MSTKQKKSDAIKFLEKLSGGPLSISELLFALRKSDEITQQDFAKKLGISKQHLCDIEHGRKAVTPTRAAVFATKLGQPPAFFIQLALDAELKHAGLKIKIKVEAA